ncbi:KxYKxGKxW signal peptide domain-containing protein [Limosilactobacillus reuteri]|uniref:KxYKxGKxW signal peptide domain-containing protein n=1 Tax=Limosilactobacillus reuteri TaxID=1598 RepID=UPI002AAC0DE9|nr:KxYKxGKxW signal peptide domain-containing protein [Limosilactobacillus reuteri]WPU43634.1 KxYKxGKxW signal peptide domain-containing protein [Limosilactobacillus reuteri]
MAKEHKKLYKAGKNWVVATLTATTITLLGGIGAYTAHADTTAENNQSVQESQINQGGNQSTSATSTTETAFAATNSSNELDPNIYGTVNVKDWDYQDSNNSNYSYEV